MERLARRFPSPRAGRPASGGTGCSRRSVSTPPSVCAERTQRRPEAATPSGSSRSRSAPSRSSPASDQSRWFSTLEAEHDNLRAALVLLGVTGDRVSRLRLAVALSRFWYVRGYLAEGRASPRRGAPGRARPPAPLLRRAHTASAAHALLQGDYAAATASSEEALAAARRDGEPRFVANALSNLGAIVLAAGDLERAAVVLEEAVELAREVGDTRITALAINNLGDLALTTGDYARARPLFEESLALLAPAATRRTSPARCSTGAQSP